MVRSSFAILFFIRESRVRKDGTASIEIVLTVNGERCAFSTGKRVKSCNWDKTKQQVKGKDEEAQSLNNYLKAIKAKLYQKEAELLDRGFIVTAELLRDAYFDKVESLKEKTLFEVFEEHNREQEKLVGNGVSKATYWISVYTVRLLKEFVQQKYKRETLSKILCKWKRDSVISLFLYLDSVFKHKHKLIHNQAPVMNRLCPFLLNLHK